MPIKIEGKTVFPLELAKLKSENKIIYDRDTRGKSWFFLCLCPAYQPLVTLGGDTFTTSDGNDFLVVGEG